MEIVAAIAVLGILIIVHEAGHFLAARWQNIHVNRFSIGFGPILWKYQGPETEYAVRGFPLGGFVGFPDDEPNSNIPPDDPNLLRNRPIMDRAIVMSAGVIANLIFAYFLLVVQAGTVGVQEVNHLPGVLVSDISEKTSLVAAKAGLKTGDVIIAVNGQELGTSKEAVTNLVSQIKNNIDQTLQFKVQREKAELLLQVSPEAGIDGKGRIGVQLAPNSQIIRRKSPNFLMAFGQGADDFQKLVTLTIQGFGQLIMNFQQTAQQVAGPVAIVDMGAKIARSDASNLFQFAALISINLAIINILPLPALDGGQLAFLVAEALRGKPLPEKLQENVMRTGLVLLLGLGMVLIVRDTINLADPEWIKKIMKQ